MCLDLMEFCACIISAKYLQFTIGQNSLYIPWMIMNSFKEWIKHAWSLHEKILYCLLWCRIIHETIRPKLNYATIYDKCDCTYSFVCEFYSPIFFIYISKPWISEQLHFDINLSSLYQFSKLQFCFRIPKTASKRGT